MAQQLGQYGQRLAGEILVDERFLSAEGLSHAELWRFRMACVFLPSSSVKTMWRTSVIPFDDNCKPLVFSNLHEADGDPKYLSIAPTPGVDNSHFPIRIGLVDGRKGLTS
jgi:hypothetical protein